MFAILQSSSSLCLCLHIVPLHVHVWFSGKLRNHLQDYVLLLFMVQTKWDPLINQQLAKTAQRFFGFYGSIVKDLFPVTIAMYKTTNGQQHNKVMSQVLILPVNCSSNHILYNHWQERKQTLQRFTSRPTIIPCIHIHIKWRMCIVSLPLWNNTNIDRLTHYWDQTYCSNGGLCCQVWQGNWTQMQTRHTNW